VLGEKAMKPGYAHVVHPIDLVSHQLCRNHSFLGHGKVRCPGRGDEDGSAARCTISKRERNGSGQLVEFCLCQMLANGVEGLAIGPSHEQAVTSADDSFGDGCDLFWGLSRPKNHLRGPLADLAVMVDAREPEVLEGSLAQILNDTVQRCFRSCGAGLHF
jgi:hypothetical protein